MKLKTHILLDNILELSDLNFMTLNHPAPNIWLNKSFFRTTLNNCLSQCIIHGLPSFD